jgi:demethylmenaquinone methyltransferase/2-methoxy-6-polyprenyl-1,4-benzoquinol methylase
MSESLSSPKGTQPPGARTQEEASRQVREMFGRIAPRYDLLNHVLSMQLDRVWRWRVTRRVRGILERPEAVVLDLCCGTGDLTLALARAGKARVLGADFAHSMLVRARDKSPGGVFALVEADALRMPFADASFDLVTSAFGFRNLANYEGGLCEILRVLKPGGTLAILEFAEPGRGFCGDLYRWYFRSVLPKIGGMISGDSTAYSYLPASVAKFFQPEELAAVMSRAGFSSARFEVWTGGTVALHMGTRAARTPRA